MNMIFDTHAHYDDEAFDEDREELLASLWEGGIGAVTNIAADIRSSGSTMELTQRWPWMYGAIGVHPDQIEELGQEQLAWLRENTAKPKVVAIGEIGLDYYWDKADREVQKSGFIRQLRLARETGLPVVVHSRDAAQDTLEVMKSENAGDIGGVIHCFSYSVEMAREYLNMGFYIGIGGVVTFKNARKLKEVVEYMPMDRMVLETDCPYLSPAPNRGKRNSSLNLPYVVETVAEIRHMEAEEVIRLTYENAVRMYHIDQRRSMGQVCDWAGKENA